MSPKQAKAHLSEAFERFKKINSTENYNNVRKALAAYDQNEKMLRMIDEMLKREG